MATYVTPGVYTVHIDYSLYINPWFCSEGCETCNEEALAVKSQVLDDLGKAKVEHLWL